MSSLKSMLPTASFWSGNSRSTTVATVIELSWESDSVTVSDSPVDWPAGTGDALGWAAAPRYVPAMRSTTAIDTKTAGIRPLSFCGKIGRRMTILVSKPADHVHEGALRATVTMLCEHSQFPYGARLPQYAP